MLRVPSYDIRFLNRDELYEFGLNSPDMVYADLKAAELASDLGISKSELLYRKKVSYENCEKLLIEFQHHCFWHVLGIERRPVPKNVPMWQEVANSPRVRGLERWEYEYARTEYFLDYVMPSLAIEDIGEVWDDFERRTRR
jgi:hypothetical protein